MRLTSFLWATITLYLMIIIFSEHLVGNQIVISEIGESLANKARDYTTHGLAFIKYIILKLNYLSKLKNN